MSSDIIIRSFPFDLWLQNLLSFQCNVSLLRTRRKHRALEAFSWQHRAVSGYSEHSFLLQRLRALLMSGNASQGLGYNPRTNTLLAADVPIGLCCWSEWGRDEGTSGPCRLWRLRRGFWSSSSCSVPAGLAPWVNSAALVVAWTSWFGPLSETSFPFWVSRYPFSAGLFCTDEPEWDFIVCNCNSWLLHDQVAENSRGLRLLRSPRETQLGDDGVSDPATRGDAGSCLPGRLRGKAAHAPVHSCSFPGKLK